MGILERRKRQKDEVRAAILSAAWNTVMEEGWQALSIRKIADAIEYSNPVIYSHFENKEAILLEFTKDGYTKLKNKLIAAKKQSVNPAQELDDMAKAYWDFAFQNPEFYQLMFGLGMPACETVNSIPEVKAFTTVMMDSISTAIAASSDPEAVVFLKFHSYWSIVHGSVSMQMMDKQATIAVNNYDKLQDAVGGFIKTLSA